MNNELNQIWTVLPKIYFFGSGTRGPLDIVHPIVTPLLLAYDLAWPYVVPSYLIYSNVGLVPDFVCSSFYRSDDSTSVVRFRQD